MLRQQSLQEFQRLFHPALIAESHRQVEHRVGVSGITLERQPKHGDALRIITAHQMFDAPPREGFRLRVVRPADDDPVARHHHFRRTRSSDELLGQVLAHGIQKRVSLETSPGFRQLIAIKVLEGQLNFVGRVWHQIRVWGSK